MTIWENKVNIASAIVSGYGKLSDQTGAAMLNKFFQMPRWYKAWTISVSLALLYAVYGYFSVGRTLPVTIAMVYVLVSILIDNYLFPPGRRTDPPAAKHKN